MQTRHQRKQLECAVCFEAITLRGRIDPCDHFFCVGCISRWAQTENTCPICKRRFRSILTTPTRPLYSDRARRQVGRQQVQLRNQGQTNLMPQIYSEQLDSVELESVSQDLNFLHYLLALEEELNNF